VKARAETWLRSRLRTIPLLRAARSRFSPTARREARDDERLRLLLAFVLGEDSNCIDVGAHRGGVLEHIVRLAPRGRHIAFEPLPELCTELRERFPGVDVRESALSNERGERTFVFVQNHPALSGFRRRDYPSAPVMREISVEVDRLDDSLPEGYVPALIKIDVEGAEREVLEGALETIARHRPAVVFEHGKGAAPHYGTQPRDLYGLLCDRAGLRIFDLDGNGPFALRDLERIFERGDRWNFVAHR
jgi:FkbM family methyltransferase